MQDLLSGAFLPEVIMVTHTFKTWLPSQLHRYIALKVLEAVALCLDSAHSLAAVQLSSTHNQKLELVKIHSLHTQIVAGTNYKFVLDVANEQNEKLTYEATVYGEASTCAGRAAWYRFRAAWYSPVPCSPEPVAAGQIVSSSSRCCLSVSLDDMPHNIAEPLGGQQKQLTQQRVLPKSDVSRSLSWRHRRLQCRVYA